MYAKEDRERILADWRESGMTMRAFSRQPGRPAADTLARWARQAERGELRVPERAVRGRADRPKHGRYPEATRREALRLLAKGMRPCDVARRLNVSGGAVVTYWRKAAESPPRPRRRTTMGPKEAFGMEFDFLERDVDLGSLTREELEAKCREELLENRVMWELMRDPKAGDPARLSNKQLTALGERLRADFGCSLAEVLSLFGMWKSTYEYDVRANERDAAREAEVDAHVRAAFEAGRGCYGYRRVRAQMAREDPPFAASEGEVRASMRRQGLAGRKTRRRAAYSSYAGEPDERPANVPLGERGAHDFSAPAPGMMVVSDVTEFKAGGAKVYLSPMIDCFDGMPAAHSESLHPDSELCDSSLEAYLATLPEGRGPVVGHTDGGGPYRAASWKRICERGDVVRSMSRKGNCGDNARAEGFFGILKEEFYNGRDWSQVPAARFVERLRDYLDWYVDGRLKAFVEDGKIVYDTIAGRRRRLGYDF